MLIPLMKFEGSDTAKQMNRIFAENLQDLLKKLDDGKGEFEPGFIHTSTMQHEGYCYFKETWSRDGGRGLIELARLGFDKEALLIARYFLRNKNYHNHWGRVLQLKNDGPYEIDGNVTILLGLFNTWKINGKKNDIAREFIEGTMPVFQWMKTLMDECPYGNLLPCESEMSGNPYTHYQVYGIFPNYGAREAISAFKKMASYCGMKSEEEYLKILERKLEQSILDCLISKDQRSLTLSGCWMNGLDGRDGRPYDFSEWVGTTWPVYHWTRQLPYIISADHSGFSMTKDKLLSINKKTYEYILSYMCSSKYFRKYGFVSNTGWTGTGGRHDETMCGYGQGYMTQASLLMDDINVYTKLLEGITCLAYDGDVVEPLSFEMNPWVMHECFNFENFVKRIFRTILAMRGIWCRKRRLLRQLS